MSAIVGYTGFVGSNLLGSIVFDDMYNSKNFHEAIGKHFDTLYISALPAEKWKINKDPDSDIININGLKKILKTITCNRLILISTIDVYEYPSDEKDEDYDCDWINNHHYGRNRFLFELFIMEQFPVYNIIRIPGLFGKGLKKNIIFDLIKNNSSQFENISGESSFQWYNLDWLYDDIQIVINNNIKVCNLFTEPIKTKLILNLFPEYSPNLFKGTSKTVYNTKTKYSLLFNCRNGYTRMKDEILSSISSFILYERLNKSQLCVSNICINKVSQKQFASILKLYGISNVQVAPTKLIGNWDNTKKLPILLEDFKDLNICNFQSITFGISDNIFGTFEERNRLLEHIKRVIDIAKSTKSVRTLVFGCPRNRKISSNIITLEEENIFIEFFRNLGNYCSDKNITICLEPNSKQYSCNYLNTSTEVVNIVRRINNPNIKMMIDIGSAIMEEDAIDFENINIINNVDISESNMEPFINISEYHYEVRKELTDRGYTRIINLEMLINDNEIETLCNSLDNFINFYSH